MPTSEPLVVRVMLPADVPCAMGLKESAGWNQLPGDWQRLLAWEPQGCFVAEWEGQFVGTATTTRYQDRFGWIGMVLVHPEQRSKGIGRALMAACIEYLDGAGVGAVKLDATPMGKPLYESLGFVDEYVLERHVIACEGGGEAAGVERMTEGHLEAVCAVDAEVFGADRGHVLARLLGDEGMVAYIVMAEGVRGYAFLRPGANAAYLGPWVAGTPEVAAKLLARVVMDHAGARLFADLNMSNSQVAPLAAEYGTERQRELVRMVRGDNAHPGAPELVFGIAGPEIG